MAKFILIWSVILLLLAVMANSLLSDAEDNCRDSCAVDGKTYKYSPPRGRKNGSRPATCQCLQEQ